MPSATLDIASVKADESIASHPLGVKPLGNQYLHNGPNSRDSLGGWAVLPDELLVVVLEHLEATSLRNLGSACRFFYAFCRAEELWKSLFLSHNLQQGGSPSWRGSWRSTVLRLPDTANATIDCSGVFSDVLHRPFACSQINLSKFASHIPRRNQMRRFDNLSYQQYAKEWSEQPFILTRCIQEWPAYARWTLETLLEEYADIEFRAEAVDWDFSTYCQYMRRNQDESPLYLFDRQFAEKMHISVGSQTGAAYWRPECFGPDLFEVLGEERPAHRWLIIGPRTSGSTFHKDPNGTSAWNAVIQGSKYWIMFPPSAQVPGVYVSRDGSEVTSPLSIAEWLLTFHEEARQLPGCVEGICGRGEILHVPSGWWHLVVNLEDGIALTQNFVPQSPSLRLLSQVLSFLRDKPDQVSGFRPEVTDPFALFSERLREQYPELLERGLALADRTAGTKRKWDAAIAGGDRGGFSFAFGEQDRGGFSFAFGEDVDEIPET